MSDTTRQHLVTALQSLGSTLGDVVDALEAGGWRGFRYDTGACPIARYLIAVVPEVRCVGIAADEATAFAVDDQDIEVDLPPAVSDFVRAFDAGNFDHLAIGPYDDDGEPDDDL
jgi:hypothetical protein